MIAFYDDVPSKLEKVGNGSFLYRWEIKKSVNEEDKHELYKCEEVVVWQPLSANKITKAVLTEKWDKNYEQKLVNEYNSAILGLYPEEVSKAKMKAYKDFLLERDSLKKQIDEDFNQFNN